MFESFMKGYKSPNNKNENNSTEKNLHSRKEQTIPELKQLEREIKDKNPKNIVLVSNKQGKIYSQLGCHQMQRPLK